MTLEKSQSPLRRAVQESGCAGRYNGWVAEFRVEEFQPQVYWIYDRQTRVAMVHGTAHTLELVNFLPDQPRPVAYPEIYHAPTAPGDRITLAHWVEWAQATTSARYELRFSPGGTSLTVTFDETFADGMHSVKDCTLTVDPDLGYAVRVSCRVESPVLHQVEFVNFLPQNVVDDQPGRQRFPAVLWQHPDGRFLRWNQNNVGAFALGNRDHFGSRQIDRHGFLGYFGEADRCPVVEFLGTNHPISAATCHNMLDEHLHWLVSAELPPPCNSSGNYCYEADFILGALPGPAGRFLEAPAVQNDLLLDRWDATVAKRNGQGDCFQYRAGQPRTLNLVPFRQQCACDFTERLKPGVSDRVEVFDYPDDDPAAPICISATGGRLTPPCLRLQPTGPRLAAGPDNGCSFHVTPDRDYTFSAWIKTALKPGGRARLHVWEWLYTPANLTRNYYSREIEDSTDWTRVAVAFRPRGVKTHCLSVAIEAEGEGTVWTDEWRLAGTSG